MLTLILPFESVFLFEFFKKVLTIATTLAVTMDTKGRERASLDEKKQKRKRMKKILSDIQKQLEFYFSDSNLRKDRFIKQEMDKAEDGCKRKKMRTPNLRS